MQSSAAKEQVKRSARLQHNDAAAAAIAQLRITSDKLRPDSFIWEQTHGESRERIRDIIEELQAQQVPLTTVMVGHPDPKVRTGMEDVRRSPYVALPAVSAFVATFSGLEEGQPHGDDMQGKREKAKESWQALRDSIDNLATTMHQDSGLGVSAACQGCSSTRRWRDHLSNHHHRTTHHALLNRHATGQPCSRSNRWMIGWNLAASSRPG